MCKNTPSPTCIGPDGSVVREHTIVRSSCLTFSACSRAGEMEITAT